MVEETSVTALMAVVSVDRQTDKKKDSTIA